ncbi:MAG TPA: MBL fold metallo-hydrolase [Pseudonocardiaceae bacterium]|jgi:glyoxylase-like metal-dependent hydrolase (beta-lactamase superfamily II)|nr:MBL fold metallo-hydrolase [Pseudonocardiaceae bacterium]
MAARIDRVVTAGTLSLDGQTCAVENNVWLIGDDEQVLVVDAAHDADAIRLATGNRQVCAIVCTHGHHDHVNAALALAKEVGAPVLLHQADLALWQQTYPDRIPDGELAQGEVMRVAAVEVRVLATPGHTPGSVCLYVPALRAVLSGDTLLAGGPGTTGWSHSDFPAIISSIRDRLLSLPAPTRVLPGHGETTTIRDEAGHLDEWIVRGY